MSYETKVSTPLQSCTQPTVESISTAPAALLYLGRAVMLIHDIGAKIVQIFNEVIGQLYRYLEALYESLQNAFYDASFNLRDMLQKGKEHKPSLESLSKASEVLKQYRQQDIAKDGNCLFKAVSYSLYGTEERHAQLRKECCEKIAIEEFAADYLLSTPHSDEGLKDYYEGWCVRTAEEQNPALKDMRRDMGIRAAIVEQGKESIRAALTAKLTKEPSAVDIYKAFMSQDKSHGGEIELTVLVEMLQRPILVFKGRDAHLVPTAEASTFGREYKGKSPIILYNMPGHYDAYVPAPLLH
ncbi:MAG: hypothetical protein JSR46_08400 [Verrucomicrobia bacterium]|nr:hypothetical protein [Verrucomicrobiota bacterium]